MCGGDRILNYKILTNDENMVVLKTEKENIITLFFSEKDNEDAENIILNSLVSSYENRVMKINN